MHVEFILPSFIHSVFIKHLPVPGVLREVRDTEMNRLNTYHQIMHIVTGSKATSNVNTICGKTDRGQSGWPGDRRALNLKPCDLESFMALDKSIFVSLSFPMSKNEGKRTCFVRF